MPSWSNLWWRSSWWLLLRRCRRSAQNQSALLRWRPGESGSGKLYRHSPAAFAVSAACLRLRVFAIHWQRLATKAHHDGSARSWSEQTRRHTPPWRQCKIPSASVNSLQLTVECKPPFFCTPRWCGSSGHRFLTHSVAKFQLWRYPITAHVTQ